MDFGFSDSWKQKGSIKQVEEEVAHRKIPTSLQALLFMAFGWGPTSHLIHGTHQPHFPTFFASSIPHSTAWSIALKCVLRDSPFFLNCPPTRVYTLLPCTQKHHNLTSIYFDLPSTTTPYSTPWSSQIGSLFVPCALLLLSLLPFCLLAMPHPPTCGSWNLTHGLMPKSDVSSALRAFSDHSCWKRGSLWIPRVLGPSFHGPKFMLPHIITIYVHISPFTLCGVSDSWRQEPDLIHFSILPTV